VGESYNKRGKGGRAVDGFIGIDKLMANIKKPGETASK
jgi:hypothetical protein